MHLGGCDRYRCRGSSSCPGSPDGLKVIYVLLALMLVGGVLYYFYKRKSDKYQRRIEEIEKENIERNYRMKIELFTNFSHELRTPLTLITGRRKIFCRMRLLPHKFLFPMKQIYKNRIACFCLSTN